MIDDRNTREFWEHRFSSGDWEEKGGRWQTESFARRLILNLDIPSDFKGSILDFGCGLGDAIPIYKEHFPKAKFYGVDHSMSAVERCRKRFGSIATFLQGDYAVVPEVDVIVSTAVFEHLSDDLAIARDLLLKCKSLYITVPYKERPRCKDHANTYDETYYQGLSRCDSTVFLCKGWSYYGFKLWYKVYFKNVFRFLLGWQILSQRKMITFHLKGNRHSQEEAVREHTAKV